MEFAVASGGLISAQLKVLRIELRATFRYIRNEYMHNLQELTRTQCLARLGRISNLLWLLDEVEKVLQTHAS
jgi:hypothetical protein